MPAPDAIEDGVAIRDMISRLERMARSRAAWQQANNGPALDGLIIDPLDPFSPTDLWVVNLTVKLLRFNASTDPEWGESRIQIGRVTFHEPMPELRTI